MIKLYSSLLIELKESISLTMYSTKNMFIYTQKSNLKFLRAGLEIFLETIRSTFTCKIMNQSSTLIKKCKSLISLQKCKQFHLLLSSNYWSKINNNRSFCTFEIDFFRFELAINFCLFLEWSLFQFFHF